MAQLTARLTAQSTAMPNAAAMVERHRQPAAGHNNEGQGQI
jgi:hypothetical protein